MINNAINEGNIWGFSLCRGGPKISHLFFADDSLLFCQAKLEEVNTIQSILKVYEKASDQQIKTEKAALFFSKSVTESTKNSIKDLLCVSEIKQYEKYLGLPAVAAKNRRASLYYIKIKFGKNYRVEGKTPMSGREKSALKGNSASHTHFCNGLFQTPIRSLRGH